MIMPPRNNRSLLYNRSINPHTFSIQKGQNRETVMIKKAIYQALSRGEKRARNFPETCKLYLRLKIKTSANN